jgi:hypothetical protein
MGTVFSPATLRPTPAEMVAKYADMPAEMVFMHEDLMRVDMHVGGAGSILSALGLKPAEALDGGSDLIGECSAEDFLGRVLLALAEQPEDEGMPSYESHPRWNVGARPAGYMQRHLHELHALAQYCREQDMIVAWA